MCGIAGIFCVDRSRTIDSAMLERMTRSIAHRGPDGQGVRVRPGYGLGHRRLSIVDLAGGSQPMADDSARYWVTFNGEIYNYLELRSELERLGHRFSTRSDTEVLVHGYREWGDGLAARLRGMFAFAIVDEVEHRLYAARDRIGKKPFYWTTVDAGREFLFGSELKVLVEDPRVRRELDPVALRQYFCLRYVPDPLTIYRGVHKLRPGHQLTIDTRGEVRETRYWQLSFAAPRVRSIDEFAEEILEQLDDAVRVRLMGDVPLGAFLSGGVDSFAIVDSMSRVSTGRVVACSVGFDESGFDERPYAREAARQCGAELHEECVESDAMLDQAWHDDAFDEPFADASSIPTYHVSRLARRHVTVALSGDGGDESFAGYRRYKFDAVENRVRGFAPRVLWSLFGAVYPKADFLPQWLRYKRTFQNLARPADDAYARSVSGALPEEVDEILQPEFRDRDDDPLEPVRRAYRAADGPDSLSRAAAADFETYLPGDILTKVDRASMAVSLEVRAPLLDHRLVEFAARIPSAMKMADGASKALFKHALRERLGDAALNRPKRGFVVPQQDWLRGPIGLALDAALADPRLQHIVRPDAVRGLLRQHRSGMRNNSSRLWGILVLHRFLRRWMP